MGDKAQKGFGTARNADWLDWLHVVLDTLKVLFHTAGLSTILIFIGRKTFFSPC